MSHEFNRSEDDSSLDTSEYKVESDSDSTAKNERTVGMSDKTDDQQKMSFAEFWSKSLREENSGSQATEAGLVSTLRAGITAATNACLLADPLSVNFQSTLGFKSKQELIQEFSQKVSDYTSSEEVISTLSEEIGSPKEDESEDEFVERAKAVLKSILRKKFRM